MEKEEIRQKLLTNVGNILTQRKIKVGEFEKEIGVYPGLLATALTWLLNARAADAIPSGRTLRTSCSSLPRC